MRLNGRSELGCDAAVQVATLVGIRFEIRLDVTVFSGINAAALAAVLALRATSLAHLCAAVSAATPSAALATNLVSPRGGALDALPSRHLKFTMASQLPRLV